MAPCHGIAIVDADEDLPGQMKTSGVAFAASKACGSQGSAAGNDKARHRPSYLLGFYSFLIALDAGI